MYVGSPKVLKCDQRCSLSLVEKKENTELELEVTELVKEKKIE